METIDMSVNIAGVKFKNPVFTCSGTFGSGREYSEFFELDKLGAVVCKGVSNIPWNGNPAPRIAEVFGGVLNCVGLQNPGVDLFITNDIPFLKEFDVKIIANLAGHSIGEYCDVAEKLNDSDVDMMELNISCPNVKEGGAEFGTDRHLAELVTKEVRKVCKKPLIVKLSPNVSNITEVAKAVECGGADAISLINTIVGMSIDIIRKKPILSMNTGGMSGPAIKPIALRMVYESAKSVKIPIIGMGGINSAEDAIEFILAGASAIAIGASHFKNPFVSVEAVKGIKKYMKREGFNSIKEIQSSFSPN